MSKNKMEPKQLTLNKLRKFYSHELPKDGNIEDKDFLEKEGFKDKNELLEFYYEVHQYNLEQKRIKKRAEKYKEKKEKELKEKKQKEAKKELTKGKKKRKHQKRKN
jgi:hypothetical protein